MIRNTLIIAVVALYYSGCASYRVWRFNAGYDAMDHAIKTDHASGYLAGVLTRFKLAAAIASLKDHAAKIENGNPTAFADCILAIPKDHKLNDQDIDGCIAGNTGTPTSCGDWKVRQPDGAVCRECKDAKGPYAECHTTVEKKRGN